MKNPELMERLAATGARLAGLVVARVFLDGLMPPNGVMPSVVVALPHLTMLSRFSCCIERAPSLCHNENGAKGLFALFAKMPKGKKRKQGVLP